MFHVPDNMNDEITRLPTFAVDVSGAYTDGKKGTGFAFRTPEKSHAEDLTQTEVIKQIAGCLEELRDGGIGTVNLILEAPLSYAVAVKASSDARLRDIEKPQSYPLLALPPDRPRPWNSNAGASTAMMALVLLADLRSRAPEGISVNLFEGFWSWLPKPRKHAEVALGLLNGMRSNHVIRLAVGAVAYRTAVELLGINSPSAGTPPWIVFGHEDLANAYHPQP